ncbi:MAG TPA: ATP-binding protein [Fimbriimonadaceae bacterium]|nr:ATP-binding protein [Fimbriimonadaceae bacterium]
MFKRLSLRVQLILVITLTSALTLVGAFAAFLVYDLSEFKEKMANGMLIQAEIIGENTTAALLFKDAKAATESLASLKASPEIDYARLVDTDGKTLALFQKDGLKSIPITSLNPGSRFKGDHLETTRVIRSNGERVGTLAIVSNLKEWKGRRDAYLSGMALVTILFVVAAALIGTYLQSIVTKPLVELSATMHNVTQSRDYSTRVTIDSGQEVGVLIDGFNSMLAEIESRESELTAANQELDLRVRQRTQELELEVAERRVAEEEVRVSQRQLADFFQFAPMGLVKIDESGTILEANNAFLTMLGQPSATVMGHRFHDLAVNGEDIETIMQRLRAGESISNHESKVRTACGNERLVEINANALWADSEMVHARLFVHDVTVEREAEEAQEARERAERANLAKSEFLSRMSHELRTPMNAILGFGQLLELEDLSASQRECVDHILRGGRHLLNLINEVLNISKIEAGAMSISVEPVPVQQAIQEAVELVSPLALKRNISVETNLNLADSKCVFADRQRFNQVILNLLSNAVKYNVEGGSVCVTIEEAGDDRARICVTDTGPGVPATVADRLFIPFDRLGAESSGIEGTGLGLSHSRSLAEAMGGTLDLDRTHQGRGAKFYVELPWATTPALLVSENLEYVSTSRAPGSGKPVTVLLIEDNQANVELIEQTFKSRPNVNLIVAMQGALGVEFALSQEPDLILLDVNLPDLDGDAVAKRIRESAKGATVPILVISADATTETRKKFRDYDVLAYLTKPLNIRQVIDIVDELGQEELPISA